MFNKYTFATLRVPRSLIFYTPSFHKKESVTTNHGSPVNPHACQFTRLERKPKREKSRITTGSAANRRRTVTARTFDGVRSRGKKQYSLPTRRYYSKSELSYGHSRTVSNDADAVTRAARKELNANREREGFFVRDGVFFRRAPIAKR